MTRLIACVAILAAAGCSRTVPEDEVRQMFIDATDGTTIEIPAGTYEFDRSLVVRANDLTITGAGQDNTVLSFKQQQQGAEGVLVSGDRVRIEALAIVDTPGDALKINQSDGVTIRGVRTEWTRGPHTENGAYGIYPVQCNDVLIEDSVAIAASDAGIYVGQSTNIIVRDSLARDNVAGIEIENSTNADVYGNTVTANTGGILVFDLPNLPVQGGRLTRVFRNSVTSNNTANFAPPGNTVAGVPAGTGIMVSANDDIEVFENTVVGNQTANVIVVSYLITGNEVTDANYDPYPERIYVHDNVLGDGGQAPDSEPLQALVETTGEPVPDVVWDGYERDEGSSVLCLKNNGDATFVNLNAPNGFEASFDSAPHSCDLPALAEVVIGG